MENQKSLGVAFIWHMHQPFYKDPISDKYLMPWVRLRGVKDYYPMAHLVDASERARVTFNLVPSLIEQIIDYTDNGATDTFLDLTVKKASSLTLEDRVEILNNFFKVNFKRFIEPNARYSELLIKKGVRPVSGAALKKLVNDFSDADFRDLQVLFNLAWFHSVNIEEDINLKDLIDKKRSYTEQDKEFIVLKQKEILSRIIPLYKKLAESGKIEISTTPYYHPILPLLCDTSVAKESLPGAPLPKKFSHPEDAAWQIEEAIKFHTRIFGAPPKGMWPSEGSVSDEALKIMISKGINWAATDEDILFKSLSLYDAKYKDQELFDRRIIYRPYKFKRGHHHISLVFRDKNLSDLISFSYNTWNPVDAARDLMEHLNRTAENLRRDTERALLTIVMDGENAWEYYEDNGRKFFETLYSELDHGKNTYSTTISDFLNIEHPKRSLSAIFPGSWIDHNFRIWIGEEQDNVSWDYLGRVRQDLVKFTKEYHKKADNKPVKLAEAWRELYIAEGSDWNWWYGGKAHNGGDNPFDKLYRTHLKNVYKFLKKPIPDFLKISIA